MQMSKLNSYFIESLAPLVFRSGKPFGSVSGIQDVVFPLPSAGAGLIRALAIGQNKLDFAQNRVVNEQDGAYQKVLSLRSQGVFLVRVYDDITKSPEILVAKPANAVYIEIDNNTSDGAKIVRLSPKSFEETCGSDLPEGLLPVQMTEDTRQKPYKGGASFWTLEHLARWQNGESLSFDEVNQAGLRNLPIELRTHVAIDAVSQSGEDRKLFQTASFDMSHQRLTGEDFGKSNQAWQDFRYGFMVQSEVVLDKDLATLGGERRLSHFNIIELSQPTIDKAKLLADINKAEGFCLTFITPAIFENGYLPKRLLEGNLPDCELHCQLKAVASDRWLAVSGWDSLLWKPKAMRKAVNAGSVYWFSLEQPLSEVALAYLLNNPISDDIQDCRDGFGLVTVAPWQPPV